MKTLTSKTLVAVAFGILVLTASCSTPKQTTYLQDMAYNKAYAALPAPELILQPEDRLDIQVVSENPQLAAPFNGALSNSDSPVNRLDTKYTIDADGYIEYPVLGKIYVAGKTIASVKKMLAERIIQSGYIKEPVIKIKLDNFSITVIGNAGNQILQVDGSSINLFQVLAHAGGVSTNSKIKDVMVVRTENGNRTAYSVNLMSKSVYESPVYYLRQNDMVYVKPRGSSLSSEGQVTMTFVGTGLTLTSIITNFLIWTRYR